jgi:hypothetical protein
MPRTQTDDLAAVLPCSIDGPLQIVDASNCGTWIKVDPAAAQIAAGGEAGPVRGALAGYSRTYLSATASYLGSMMAAHYVNNMSTGGFYATPLSLPPDMDVARPCSVRICVTPQQNASTNGQVVRFGLAYTRAAAAGSWSDGNLSYDWSVPDNWSTADIAIVPLDNGNGRTYEADTFTKGDVLGFRISRAGANPIDTFNKPVKFADWILLEYRAKVF